MRPNFYVSEYFHHKLATLVAPSTDGTAICLVNYKHTWSSNKQRKQDPNRCIIGDAILPQTGTKLTKNAVLNLALCCGAIWRHREKPRHRCTTTINPIYNCSEFFWENILPVWLLVRTSLYIPSRLWTTDAKFDTCNDVRKKNSTAVV